VTIVAAQGWQAEVLAKAAFLGGLRHGPALLTIDWHPVAVAWGIVGSYLLLAVELTSLARTRLPRTLWRRVHYASFLLFAATTVHGLSAGTDARSPAFLIANVAVCGLVIALAAARVLQSARYPSVAATLPSQNRQVRAAR